MAEEPQKVTPQQEAENKAIEPIKEDPNANKKDIIIKKLGAGMWFRDSCTMAGIDESTGHRWKQSDASFASRVEAAIIEYKEKLITCVNLGALKNPKVAIRVLETRWSEEWNAVKKIEIVDPQKELQRIEGLIYGSNPPTEGTT